MRIAEASKGLHHVTYDNIIMQMIQIEKHLDEVLAILGDDIEQ